MLIDLLSCHFIGAFPIKEFLEKTSCEHPKCDKAAMAFVTFLQSSYKTPPELLIIKMCSNHTVAAVQFLSNEVLIGPKLPAHLALPPSSPRRTVIEADAIEVWKNLNKHRRNIGRPAVVFSRDLRMKLLSKLKKYSVHEMNLVTSFIVKEVKSRKMSMKLLNVGRHKGPVFLQDEPFFKKCLEQANEGREAVYEFPLAV